MATVKKLSLKVPDRVSAQGEVEASVILLEHDGEKFIQIDTYGSKERKFVGKRSQSLRLSAEAFEQLLKLGSSHVF